MNLHVLEQCYFQKNPAFTARAVLVQGVRGFCSQSKLCSEYSHRFKGSSTSSKRFVKVPKSSGRSLVQLATIGAPKISKMEFDESLPSGYRCAIITGVARSTAIGRTLVHQFLQSGYRVVGADICDLEHGGFEAGSSDKLPADKFHFVQADISDPLQAKRIVDEAIQKFGGSIHVLINNAGRTNPFLFGEDRIKAFTETIAVNLNGAYYMSEFALPYMPAGQSSIIHIASTRALQSEPNSEGYAASKAGLCGLTHAQTIKGGSIFEPQDLLSFVSQAVTLSGKVRVNVVLPGWINTDPSGNAALRPADHEWHPAGRVGVPDDVAHMCLFLCDSKRAGFITGQQFVVDGGVTKKMIYPED